MSRIKKAAYIAMAGIWLSALFGGLLFAGAFPVRGGGAFPDGQEKAEESAAEEGREQLRVWEVVFKGMKFTLPQKGKVYLHGSGCMNIRRNERYLIQINIEEDTVDEMWARMEQKKESLIRAGYRMEKEAERLADEECNYVRYVVSLGKERGSDFERSYSEVILAPADEGRHILAVIPYDGIDMEKLDAAMREKLYDEAFVEAGEILAEACPTEELDDEVGMLWTEDKSIDPDHQYISEDTIVYGEGQYSLSYKLPEHCMLTADDISGKTYFNEDYQVYVRANVLKYTWMTARDMAESIADRNLSRPLASGEVKVNGRTFYYYTYSVLEYGKNEVSTTYQFHGYCDLEDGSIYSIFGYGTDNPEAAEEACYLEWMNINIL